MLPGMVDAQPAPEPKRIGKRAGSIVANLWSVQRIRREFQPEFLGVDSTDQLLAHLMLAPLVLHDPAFFREMDHTRQCFQCRRMETRGVFPARHVCGRCTAVVYCSRHCQALHWLQGHRAECACNDDFKRSHRCLELALKVVTRLEDTGELLRHMDRHDCRKRLLVVARNDAGHLVIFPVKLDFVSCLPLSDEGKQFLRRAVTSSRARRVLLGVEQGEATEFLSCEV